MPLNIAIDGPVGAGKSTVAEDVSKRLGILHLDTGAMYRAVGLTALRRGIDPKDGEAVTAMCDTLHMTVTYAEQKQHTFVDGEDVTPFLRTEEVSMAASAVSGHPGVRRAMVALQQKLAAETDMLLDGRDIGTRVLPHAGIKIYLTASEEERARRRYQQLTEAGTAADYKRVLEDLRRRDAQDMNRAVDPLRRAEDAILVDSSDLDYEATVRAILRIVEERR